MASKEVTSLRGTLDFLKKENELLVIKAPVDPVLEVSGLQAALNGGPALLFENVKGFPNARITCNVCTTKERAAKVFGLDDPKKYKFKCLESLRKPIAPKVITDAPCQEVVIKNKFDVNTILPLITHTVKDPGRTLGGGISFVSGKYFWGGTHVSFNRMHFRGGNSSSFQINPGSHLDQITTAFYKKEPIPMTVNIGVSPGVLVAAGAGYVYTILKPGCDEVGFAGALEGYPVEIVKAQTVDAYSIANSEWVIEGYIDTNEKVWESEEAEKAGKQGTFPFHPEWTGYLGRAYRTFKFTATALTHRRDKPIHYTPIVHRIGENPLYNAVREAALWEFAEGISPGFVTDVHIPAGMPGYSGVIFQVRKRRKRDEGFQRNLLTAVLGASQGLRIAIAVDEDVDIYSADDVWWAVSTRVSIPKDVLIAPGGRGQTFQPAERAAARQGSEWIASETVFEAGMGLDATVPWDAKFAFERACFPVDKVDLSKFLSKEEIAAVRAVQSDYSKVLARTGW